MQESSPELEELSDAKQQIMEDQQKELIEERSEPLRKYNIYVAIQPPMYERRNDYSCELNYVVVEELILITSPLRRVDFRIRLVGLCICRPTMSCLKFIKKLLIVIIWFFELSLALKNKKWQNRFLETIMSIWS